MVALTRCSGIILGVFLSVILAVLVFPKSASHQATDNLSEALQNACNLCQLAWHSSQRQDIFIQANASSVDGAYISLGSESSTQVEKTASVEDKELECEKVCARFLYSCKLLQCLFLTASFKHITLTMNELVSKARLVHLLACMG